MSNPHEFLVGKDPIKEMRICPKCNGEVWYYSGGRDQCQLCGFTGFPDEFKDIKVATVDWEKFARALK